MVRKFQISYSLILVLIWMAVIFGFSHQANSNEMTKSVLGPLNILVRKCAHMTEYAVLFLLSLNLSQQIARTNFGKTRVIYGFFLSGLRLTKPKRMADLLSAFAAPFMIAFLYACTDEWHQSFVPGRSAAFSDVVVDSTGILFAACVVAFLAISRK